MTDVDVVVVGGGPVGLYLGCLLAVRGHSFVVLEERRAPVDHSRSIGIHPPLLVSMEQIGLADRLVADGVRIRRGRGYWNRFSIGTMDFSRLPGPYRFVLSLPQTRTETHLRERLAELAPGTLLSGERVTSVIEEGDRLRIQACTAGATGPESREWTARLVVGCDGKHGIVRRDAGFEFAGGSYPDRYLMGDFAESTDLGSDAALCLGRAGLVESFPLPSGERRWVVRLTGEAERGEPDENRATPIETRIAEIVGARTPFQIDPATTTMTSGFGVERYEARPMARDRVFLAGDAAHVISPIGGQGMNLGWMDADALADILENAAAAGSVCSDGRMTVPAAAARYARERAKVYRRARRRAEFNMWMGRARSDVPTGAFRAGLKAVTARLILVPGIRAACARQFTMHGLDARSG